MARNHRRHQHEATTRPAGINNRQDVQQASSVYFWKQVIGAFVLFPLAAVTAVTLLVMFWRACRDMEFLKSREFIWFAIGGLSWWLAWLLGARPVTMYVFGHEMSHLVTAKCFGGEIFDWKAGAEGGYVETNKSNTWITLAPYLLPFYATIIMGVFGIVGLVVDMHVSIPLWRLEIVPALVFYYLVGFTWWFHVTYTAKTVHLQQGDLTKNGEFFSMMLIFLSNAALLIFMLLAASPSPALGLGEVARCWWGVAQDMLGWFLPFV
ncbi:MAG: hypothetical protein HS117_21605 [Verrucomicrobiaceae bacterium]|nr:hypothetical protein [Verrucomicrobiaceae bacterium]